VLRRHCEDLGRDMAEIEITALDEVDLRPGRMSAGDVVARARSQAAAGVQHLIVNMPDAWDVRHLVLIGREVVPALQELAAA
ncbi:MAG: LLM class F420-dependent oxidoreductase, partial [Candidatus Limnocylindria bacterium]